MFIKKIRSLLYRILKPSVSIFFNDFRKLSEKSTEEVIQIQKKKLLNLVKFTYSFIDFYKKNYFGIAEDILSGEQQFSHLPVLTKSDLREHPRDLLPENIKEVDIFKGFTGGSTGSPVEYYYDQTAIDKMQAALRFFYTQCGWNPGEKILHLWGANQDLSIKNRLKTRISEFVTGEKTINAYTFDTNVVKEWNSVLNSYRPAVIQGYPSILYLWAKYIKENAVEVPSIKGIYSTAEVLYPKQRELIEEAFSCKVFNQYGSREVPGISCECREGNMHILTDMAYVEAVSDQETGNSRLIVTSLSNKTMPLVRYEIGDLGALKEGECACGLPFPMMDMGMCRSNDIIVTSSGKHIYPGYFNRLLDGLRHLTEYQFRQVTIDKIILYLLESQKDNNLDVYIVDIISKVDKELDSELELSVEFVNEIEKTPMGKHRFIVSDLK